PFGDVDREHPSPPVPFSLSPRYRGDQSLKMRYMNPTTTTPRKRYAAVSVCIALESHTEMASPHLSKSIEQSFIRGALTGTRYATGSRGHRPTMLRGNITADRMD